MMKSLTEKPIARSTTSWLSRPVNASAAGLSNYNGWQDAVAFWLAYSFASGDVEPLPAMFRRKTPAINREAPSAAANYFEYKGALVAGLSIFRGLNVTAILACVLFLFAVADATLLTMARFSPDQAAAPLSAPEKGAVEAVAPSAPIEVAERAQATTIKAESAQVLERSEATVNASTEKPAEAATVCAEPPLNCWKTFIR